MSRNYYGRTLGRNSLAQAGINKTRQRLGPPGLRGKALGLYFKHLGYKDYKQYKRLNHEELVVEQTQLAEVITLNLPREVEARISTHLQSIEQIAKSLNISIAHAEVCTSEKDISSLSLDKDGIEWCPYTGNDVIMIEDDDDNITVLAEDEKPKDDNIILIDENGNPNNSTITCLDGDDKWLSDNFYVDTKGSGTFTKPDSPKPENCMGDKPGISSAPDFIPVLGEPESNESEYGTGDRVLALRNEGDYKYSYEDITTSTFDEKLDECLLKGIDVDLSTKEIEDLSMDFHEEYKAMVSKSGYQWLLKFRETLPTYKKAQDILDVITNNQVIVISGETGCGKSTQVPQIILDNAICNNKGANVKILVTQPRRLAASSLALRVAEERTDRLGNSVGYTVRLEKVDARSRGSIVFCTTGILLVELEMNQGLTNYSHVILDEVHERDCNIDLSMCMLKKILEKRKDLKLILMSATIDAEEMSEYFNNCPMMHIEGLVYPVEDIYLEQILTMIKFQLPPRQQNSERQKKNYGQKSNLETAEETLYRADFGYHVFGKKPNIQRDKKTQYKADVGPWLESIKDSVDSQVYQTLQDCRIEHMQICLICDLLVHISEGPPGAVLVFLPGIGEITKVMRAMTLSKKFPESNFEIYPLHSKLPTLEQHKIFERPTEGVRKIIIATNIAETSITIDDIVYVVDCGKLKITGLKVEENLSTLKVEWISQANLRQRRGRAGRCQPGVCYHLVTSHRASLLAERLLPELQRSDLLEPVLTIKRLRLGAAADALGAVPSPPAHSTVEWAVKHLQQCGALDERETLTPLGWHLARLPVHPAAGKLLLLGALFGCLDRAASVAAVWGFKDPFQLVIDEEIEVDQAKRRFALGEPSDHIALSEAIIQWERQPHEAQNNFAVDNFLANSTLVLLSQMKRQLGDSLKHMGFLASGDVKSAWENRHVDNLSLFKALVAASLYPKIATVKWIDKKTRKHKQQNDSESQINMGIKVRTPGDDAPICLHPSSVMAPSKGPRVKLCNKPGANWLVYWLKQRSSELYLFEVTLVYTLPLLFFGELSVTVNDPNHQEDECYMGISTIKVRCKKKIAKLLIELRSLLDQVLASKVMVSSNHSTKHSLFDQCVLNAVTELITAEDEKTEYVSYNDQPKCRQQVNRFINPWGNNEETEYVTCNNQLQSTQQVNRFINPLQNNEKTEYMRYNDRPKCTQQVNRFLNPWENNEKTEYVSYNDQPKSTQQVNRFINPFQNNEKTEYMRYNDQPKPTQQLNRFINPWGNNEKTEYMRYNDQPKRTQQVNRFINPWQDDSFLYTQF